MELADFGFFMCVLLVGLLTVTLGALMLISPPMLLGFGSWVGKVFGLPPPRIQWRRGLYLDWRLAGLLLTGLGAFFAKLAISTILNPPSLQPAQTAPEAGRLGPDWYSLAGGLAMLVLGLYTLIQPFRLFRWMVEKAPFSALADRNFSAGVMFFRAVGFFWALFAIGVIVFSLKGLK